MIHYVYPALNFLNNKPGFKRLMLFVLKMLTGRDFLITGTSDCSLLTSLQHSLLVLSSSFRKCPYLLEQLVFVHFSYNNGLFHLLRSGELCRQRWNQMVRMIGGHREKPFIEQVEVLARRYCPEMLDYRKAESSDLAPIELT